MIEQKQPPDEIAAGEHGLSEVTVWCALCGARLSATVGRVEGGLPDEEDWEASVDYCPCITSHEGISIDLARTLEDAAIAKAVAA